VTNSDQSPDAIRAISVPKPPWMAGARGQEIYDNRVARLAEIQDRDANSLGYLAPNPGLLIVERRVAARSAVSLPGD